MLVTNGFTFRIRGGRAAAGLTDADSGEIGMGWDIMDIKVETTSGNKGL